MQIAGGSEPGIRRGRNDDAYLHERLTPCAALFGIADGFGTVGRGAPIAVVALETVRDYLRGHRRLGTEGRIASVASIRALLLAALDHANARLYAWGGSHDDFVGSGASLTVVLVVGRHAFVGHVGDARAYLLRRGRLESLTADDALFVGGELESGVKSVLPAKPRLRGILWRSLGTQSKLEASVAHVELTDGDQVLLCTDGVHRCIYEREIREVLGAAPTAAEVVARLLAIVKLRGNLDNGTLVVGRDLLVSQRWSESTAPSFPTWLRFTGSVVVVLAIVMTLLVLHVGGGWSH